MVKAKLYFHSSIRLFYLNVIALVCFSSKDVHGSNWQLLLAKGIGNITQILLIRYDQFTATYYIVFKN